MMKKHTALVVNPWAMDFKLYDEWMHPIGLYFLIDTLVASGVDVSYFNCLERSISAPPKKFGTGSFESRQIPKPELYKDIKRRYKWYGCSPERFREFLRGTPPPDVVFVGSMMTYWAYGVVETVRLIRETYPSAPVVCGGIAVRLMPDFFRGILPDVYFFDRPLAGGGPHFTLPGLPGEIVVPAEPSLLAGLKLATLRFHAPALITLGCPLRCSYCASNMLQPQFRQRRIETVWREMVASVSDYGIRDLAFCDDALLMDPASLLIPLLDRIIDNRLDVCLHTPNGLHLKQIDAPLLARMRDAGFTTLRFGYESGLPKHRRQTASKVDRSVLAAKLSLLREFQFPDTGVYVMGGLPGDSPEEMMEEMRFIASFGAAVKPVFVSPVPGTTLFTELAGRFPHLLSDPLWQNDTFFITRCPGWGEEEVEVVRMCAKELNRGNRPAA